MENIEVNKKDEVVMMLLHYFITERNYNPIILQGAKNEIWLENLEEKYKVIKISTDYIHNDEQFNLDIFKTKRISNHIKKRVLSFKMEVLSLYLNIGDNVTKFTENNSDFVTYFKLNKITDLNNINEIKEEFPLIEDHNHFEEEGLELFMKLTNDINKKNERDSKVAESIFTKNTPYITYALLAINILVFIMMYVLGNGSQDVITLLNFGALNKELVLSGQVYRIFTSAFIHIGILHLILNMYALYVLGPQLENYFGKIKFIIIYLFSILSGSLVSLLFSSATISAGASGAIFGLLGAMLYFGYHYRVYLGTVLKSQIIPLIVINLAIGLATPQINDAAHIGGLIAGGFISMALGVKGKSDKADIINGIIISFIYVGFITYLLINN